MEARHGHGKSARRWLDAFLPPACLLCRERLAGGLLCPACTAGLPRNPVPCPRCALPLAVPASACGRCLRSPPPFAAAWVPFLYGHPLDLLETRFKFGADLAAGRALSGLLQAAPPPSELPLALVPVPLHRGRLRERGYNQALELARPLARTLGVALGTGLLRRTRATPPQTGLDAATRRRNLRGAFALAPGAVIPEHVALFDDVMTTGATLAEAARALRRAGAQRVDVWALARTP